MCACWGPVACSVVEVNDHALSPYSNRPSHLPPAHTQPENLLLADPEGGDDTWVKLADFGYAVQVWPDEPGLRSTVGTPCYIAPEILMRQLYGKVRMVCVCMACVHVWLAAASWTSWYLLALPDLT
jgi:serine/threonine protein kinase